MLRVVADTNVYVSAFVFGGVSERVLRLAEQQYFLLYISDAITREIEEVLTEKFQYSPVALRLMKRKVSRITRRVRRVRVRIAASVDPDDDRVLECAVAAHAEFIVSGDRHLLDLHPYRNIVVVQPARFLELRAWEQ